MRSPGGRWTELTGAPIEPGLRSLRAIPLDSHRDERHQRIKRNS